MTSLGTHRVEVANYFATIANFELKPNMATPPVRLSKLVCAQITEITPVSHPSVRVFLERSTVDPALGGNWLVPIQHDSTSTVANIDGGAFLSFEEPAVAWYRVVCTQPANSPVSDPLHVSLSGGGVSS